MSDHDPEQVRERLLALREALLAGADSRSEMSRTVDLDQTRTGRLSRMDAMAAQAMARAGEQRARIELQRIEAALARVEAGTYGDCAGCGEPIEPGRLEASPATPFCLACAEARERR